MPKRGADEASGAAAGGDLSARQRSRLAGRELGQTVRDSAGHLLKLEARTPWDAVDYDDKWGREWSSRCRTAQTYDQLAVELSEWLLQLKPEWAARVGVADADECRTRCNAAVSAEAFDCLVGEIGSALLSGGGAAGNGAANKKAPASSSAERQVAGGAAKARSAKAAAPPPACAGGSIAGTVLQRARGQPVSRRSARALEALCTDGGELVVGRHDFELEVLRADEV